MAEITKIEWTDSTFNPWTGCQNVSPGCEHCYAESWANRSGIVEWGPHGVRRRTSAATWANPRKWQANAATFQRTHGRRQRVFCASLADVFDNQAPPGARGDLWNLIRQCPDLDWLLLTKRPQNIAKMLPADWGARFGYPNVWLGTTTEDEKHYRLRFPVLAAIPAVLRFISYEPAVGPLGPLNLCGPLPDWIICGGESGPKARVMQHQWAATLRDECEELLIPFFFKQWGTYASNPVPPSADPPKNGKGGGLLDGQRWRQFPTPLTADRVGPVLEPQAALL
jgi:protein gp37